MPILEGQLFDERFRILHLLGRGGMGEVWGAVDTTTNGRVAIKVLLEKAARKRDLVARFEREAQISSRIQSPYICPLLHSARAQSGELYLVFQLLEGESLSDRLKQEIQLAYDEVAALIDNVLEGLCVAHAAGVVHRDLKPGNIFVTPDQGRQKAVILDFGISKLLKREKDEKGSNEPSLTTFDATLGSFAYMAPEQVRGAARADERADIYAVGAVAFRMLTGRLPFEGDTATALLMGKLGLNAPSLGQVTGEQWPAALERFVAKSLARHRDDRFATAAEALASWREMRTRFDQAWARFKPLLDRLEASTAAA